MSVTPLILGFSSLPVNSHCLVVENDLFSHYNFWCVFLCTCGVFIMHLNILLPITMATYLPNTFTVQYFITLLHLIMT